MEPLQQCDHCVSAPPANCCGDYDIVDNGDNDIDNDDDDNYNYDCKS